MKQLVAVIAVCVSVFVVTSYGQLDKHAMRKALSQNPVFSHKRERASLVPQNVNIAFLLSDPHVHEEWISGKVNMNRPAFQTRPVKKEPIHSPSDQPPRVKAEASMNRRGAAVQQKTAGRPITAGKPARLQSMVLGQIAPTKTALPQPMPVPPRRPASIAATQKPDQSLSHTMNQIVSNARTASNKPPRVQNNIRPSANKPSLVQNNIRPSANKPSPVQHNMRPSATKSSPVQNNIRPSANKPSPVQNNIRPNANKPSPVQHNIRPSAIKPSPVQNNVRPSANKPSRVQNNIRPNANKPSLVQNNIRPSANKPSRVQNIRPNANKPSRVQNNIRPSANKPSPVQSNVRTTANKPSNVRNNVRTTVKKLSPVKNNVRQVASISTTAQQEAGNQQECSFHIPSFLLPDPDPSHIGSSQSCPSFLLPGPRINPDLVSLMVEHWTGVKNRSSPKLGSVKSKITQVEFEQKCLIPALRAHVLGEPVCRTRELKVYLEWLLYLRQKLFNI